MPPDNNNNQEQNNNKSAAEQCGEASTGNLSSRKIESVVAGGASKLSDVPTTEALPPPMASVTTASTETMAEQQHDAPIDPLEILQASLTFEQPNSSSKRISSENNDVHDRTSKYSIVPPLPHPTRLGCCRLGGLQQKPLSSVTSLYPSLECVTRETSDFDNFEVEQSWQKGAPAALKMKKKSASENQSTLSQTSPAASLTSNHSNGGSMSSMGWSYPLSYSGFNGLDGTALTSSSGDMRFSAATFPENNNACLGSPTAPATSSEVLFRLMNENSASALGCPTAPVTSSSAGIPDFGGSSFGNTNDYNDPNVTYIPVERTNHDDDDLIALKRAAYGGGDKWTWSATPDTATVPDQAAEATIVEYGVIQPLEEESVIQAEFVCQSEYEQHTNDGQQESYPYDALAQSTPRAMDSLRHPLDSNAATEATVIASGPAEKATEAAWSAVDAMEAVVLQQEEDNMSFASIDDDLDTKPPAISLIPEDAIAFVPLEQDDIVVDALTGSDPEDSQAIATVVDYDVHPSEMNSGSVQAEFLGNSSTEIGVVQAHQALEHQSTTIAENFVQINDSEEEATEATVVDSGPIGKATAEAWSTGLAEEAQVLEDNRNFTTKLTEKNDINKPVPTSGAATDIADNRILGGDAAEIVSITEDIHPSEFLSERAATAEFVGSGSMFAVPSTAELVGSDSNCVFAVPSTSDPGSAVAVQSSDERPDVASSLWTGVVVVDAQGQHSCLTNSNAEEPPQEAEATLVDVEGYQDHAVVPQRVVFAHQSSSLSTLPQSPLADERDGDASNHVTAVAVLEVENNSLTEEDFYDYPLKPSRVACRAQSEPAPPTTRNNHSEDDPRNTTTLSGDIPAALEVAPEQEWMNFPSFGGSGEVGPPPPLSPTMATAIRIEDRTGSTSSAPPVIQRTGSPTDTTSASSQAGNVANEGRIDSTRSRNESHGAHAISNNIANNVMEMLFGNARCGTVRKPISFEMDSLTALVIPRTLLSSSVIYSEATHSWVATVNTNQKALDGNNVEESSKALRAFSVPTKKQAICLARAWAPPRMHPFGSNPNCFICETQFAVFRRACHCRNCGVCVCSSCTLQWPSKMLPATYNIKNEGTVNICKACDWLCSAFRLALLNGDSEKAITLYETGNINLTTPFANVKGELFYPVHCAVLGGNLNLLKWLIDEHCCPLRSIRVSSGKQKDAKNGSYTPILTSKGRSLLGIALSARNIGIVRYLVVEKRMLLWAEKDLSIETLVQNLDLVLRILPEEALAGQQAYEHAQEATPMFDSQSNHDVAPSSTHNTTDQASSIDNDMAAAMRACSEADVDAGATGHNDDCIICFSNPIDCVVTPCGHQICCLECSKNISKCPVCSVECSFIRVFRA